MFTSQLGFFIHMLQFDLFFLFWGVFLIGFLNDFYGSYRSFLGLIFCLVNENSLNCNSNLPCYVFFAVKLLLLP